MARQQQKSKKPWRETPVIESANLSKAAGCRIFLKLENLQPSGSFKSRGLGFFVQRSLQRAQDPSRVHFYCSSGGNAGLGCVHAANFVERPSTVVVPMSTNPMMIAKIHAAGATEVVQFGSQWSEADRHMREVIMLEAEQRGEEPVYVSPFNHPDIWQGHASLVDELRVHFEAEGESPPDLLVCSVGGGGLFNGLVQGLQAQGQEWQQKTTVLAMGTVGADALSQSLRRREIVTLPGITSLATSLGASRVSDRTFELALKGHESGLVKAAVLTDAEAAMGCWRLADDERMLVELACGVNVAVCYGSRLERIMGRPMRRDEKVVIVLCGGQNVTPQMIESWRKDIGDLGDGQPNGLEIPSDADVPK